MLETTGLDNTALNIQNLKIHEKKNNKKQYTK